MAKSDLELRDKFAIAVLPVAFKCVLDLPGNESDVHHDRSYLEDIAEGETDGSTIAAVAYAIAEAMMKEREKGRIDSKFKKMLRE